MVAVMPMIAFSEVPKARYIYQTAEELEAAAEQTILRVRARELAGNLACRTEVKKVRTKKRAEAFWAPQDIPGLHLHLVDLRRHAGWFALTKTQEQKRSGMFGVRTFLINGSGERAGVARLEDQLVRGDMDLSSLEKQLFVSNMMVGHDFSNPPLPEDAIEISSALALVPPQTGNPRKKTRENS